MGEKKRKEAEVAQWKKVLVVGACLLFVVLMVVSGMGSSWLTMFSVVKPGETVLIDYTLYDAAGNPIVTTDKQVYTKAVSGNMSVLPAKQIAVIANQSLIKPIFPLSVYTSNGGWDSEFALFSTEFDIISSGLVGMKTGEKKTLTLSSTDSMTQLWTVEELNRKGISIDDVNIGDIFTLGVSDNPEEMASNKSAKTYMRVGEIVRKTPAGIVVDFGYPTADIRVVSISSNS
jgi:hypothetical protein